MSELSINKQTETLPNPSVASTTTSPNELKKTVKIQELPSVMNHVTPAGISRERSFVRPTNPQNHQVRLIVPGKHDKLRQFMKGIRVWSLNSFPLHVYLAESLNSLIPVNDLPWFILNLVSFVFIWKILLEVSVRLRICVMDEISLAIIFQLSPFHWSLFNSNFWTKFPSCSKAEIYSSASVQPLSFTPCL